MTEKLPENIQYDNCGGIIAPVGQLEKNAVAKREPEAKTGYNFLEKILLKYSRKVNYLLDENGRYKCRREKIPNVVRIGLTNRCTARCFYCPREFIHSEGSGYLEWDLYLNIIRWMKAGGIKTISFALFGEPLIHPRIMDVIGEANRSGFNIRLSTNGIALTSGLAEKITDYSPAAVEISMDGFTEKEYEAGKQVAKYNQAKANVIYFLKLAKEKKSETVFNIHFVDAGNVSFANKLKFIKFWKEQLSDLKYETSFYYEPHNWAGTRDDVKNNMNWLDRILAKWEFKKPCVYIKGLNINWNGDAYICTNDPTRTAVIGNIGKQTFEEIYNGGKRMHYLDKHEQGDFRDINCGVCTVNSIYPLLYLKKRLVNAAVGLFA